MKKQLEEVIYYSHWANKQLLQDLQAIPEAAFHQTLPLKINSIDKLLRHIIHFDANVFSA